MFFRLRTVVLVLESLRAWAGDKVCRGLFWLAVVLLGGRMAHALRDAVIDLFRKCVTVARPANWLQRRITEGMWLLIVPHGQDRLAAVRLQFTNGRHRHYLILHRPAS
jgi:hypothetical protein